MAAETGSIPWRRRRRILSWFSLTFSFSVENLICQLLLSSLTTRLQFLKKGYLGFIFLLTSLSFCSYAAMLISYIKYRTLLYKYSKVCDRIDRKAKKNIIVSEIFKYHIFDWWVAFKCKPNLHSEHIQWTHSVHDSCNITWNSVR